MTINDTTTGATIYYTNDGTTPTTGSAVYNGPLTVGFTETIQAIAEASGCNNSSVASATYTISLSPDYQLSVTPSTLTIVAGQSGTAKFTVTPMNGFSSQVSFTCSGLPSGPHAASFRPPSHPAAVIRLQALLPLARLPRVQRCGDQGHLRSI